MTVYVDDARHPFRGMLMCHMFSPHLAELHAMAARIGMERRWFQDPAAMPGVSWPHYDLSEDRRAAALAAGARALDRYQTVAMAAVIKGDPDPLRLLRRLADPARAYAPAAHVPAWLAAEGFGV